MTLPSPASQLIKVCLSVSLFLSHFLSSLIILNIYPSEQATQIPLWSCQSPCKNHPSKTPGHPEARLKCPAPSWLRFLALPASHCWTCHPWAWVSSSPSPLGNTGTHAPTDTHTRTRTHPAPSDPWTSTCPWELAGIPPGSFLWPPGSSPRLGAPHLLCAPRSVWHPRPWTHPSYWKSQATRLGHPSPPLHICLTQSHHSVDV